MVGVADPMRAFLVFWTNPMTLIHLQNLTNTPLHMHLKQSFLNRESRLRWEPLWLSKGVVNDWTNPMTLIHPILWRLIESVIILYGIWSVLCGFQSEPYVLRLLVKPLTTLSHKIRLSYTKSKSLTGKMFISFLTWNIENWRWNSEGGSTRVSLVN